MNLGALDALVTALPGTAGIVVQSLGVKSSFECNADARFPAASLIKLPVLWEFFNQCAKGIVDPLEEVHVRGEEMAPGLGVLHLITPGTRLRLRDLAVLMITVSDNTAANILIDRLGMDSINKSMRELGARETLLEQKMYAGGCLHGDNFTTPRDIAMILEAFAVKKHLLGVFGNAPLEILLAQQRKHKLHLGFPPGVKLASKTGEAPWLEHDAGLLLEEKGGSVIVVMTTGLLENRDGVDFCRQVAQLASQYLL